MFFRNMELSVKKLIGKQADDLVTMIRKYKKEDKVYSYLVKGISVMLILFCAY